MEPVSLHPDGPRITRALAAAYDELPYDGHSFDNTHPIRLATAARLRGLDAAPPDRCRVLELGCAEGSNLLPMADTYPGSEFVGVDISSTHVENANQRIQSLGATNVDIRLLDIVDVDDRLGTFDYIVCHGVFSWVPADIQDHILGVCHDLINPGGVSYLSYNAYPGWHMKEQLRKLMFDNIDDDAPIDQRIAAARERMQSVIDRIDDDSPHGTMLRTSAEAAIASSDALIAHDYLAAINEPMYFDEFVQRLRARGLRHLTDQDVRAQFHTLPLDEQDAAEEIRLQQEIDIVENATFRRAVISRDDEPVAETVTPAVLASFQVASPMAPEVEMDPEDHSEATFRCRGEVLTTTSPILKVAFDRLWQLWPASTSLRELGDEAGARLVHTGTFDSREEVDRLLLEGLSKLRAHGAVELFCHPYDFTTHGGERPVVARSARLEVSMGSPRVTNRRHESLDLDDLLRFLVLHLDGSRTESDVLGLAVEAASAGALEVTYADQTPISNPEEQARVLRWLVPKSIDTLGTTSLIVA